MIQYHYTRDALIRMIYAAREYELGIDDIGRVCRRAEFLTEGTTVPVDLIDVAVQHMTRNRPKGHFVLQYVVYLEDEDGGVTDYGVHHVCVNTTEGAARAEAFGHIRNQFAVRDYAAKVAAENGLDEDFSVVVGQVHFMWKDDA